MKKPDLHFIQLKGVPIFEQLQIEEALLRSSEDNFCIVNHGSDRAIVMGLSNEVEKLIDVDAVKKARIPVIKRFSGGGTVIVDENTLFVTFIMSKKDLDPPAFPEPILRWGEEIYKEAWNLPEFRLRENDYCIREKKCAGNAQYIRKDRWLHHTSFLWDYAEKNMSYLRLPEKRPKYRQDRSHDEFLTKLCSFGESPEELFEALKKALVKRFYIRDFDLTSWERGPHRQSTHLIEI